MTTSDLSDLLGDSVYDEHANFDIITGGVENKSFNKYINDLHSLIKIEGEETKVGGGFITDYNEEMVDDRTLTDFGDEIVEQFFNAGW